MKSILVLFILTISFSSIAQEIVIGNAVTANSFSAKDQWGYGTKLNWAGQTTIDFSVRVYEGTTITYDDKKIANFRLENMYGCEPEDVINKAIVEAKSFGKMFKIAVPKNLSFKNCVELKNAISYEDLKPQEDGDSLNQLEADLKACQSTLQLFATGSVAFGRNFQEGAIQDAQEATQSVVESTNSTSAN